MKYFMHEIWKKYICDVICVTQNEVNDNLSSNGAIVLTLSVANGYGYI